MESWHCVGKFGMCWFSEVMWRFGNVLYRKVKVELGCIQNGLVMEQYCMIRHCGVRVES